LATTRTAVPEAIETEHVAGTSQSAPLGTTLTRPEVGPAVWTVRVKFVCAAAEAAVNTSRSRLKRLSRMARSQMLSGDVIRGPREEYRVTGDDAKGSG